MGVSSKSRFGCITSPRKCPPPPQSMSKAGYPYDNAPMERYFNTLKNEYIYLYEYDTEESLYQAVEKFAYVEYNHVRPHSFNGYLTSYQARIA